MQRVGVRAEQQLADQHPANFDVVGEGRLALHQFARIDFLLRFADLLERVDFRARPPSWASVRVLTLGAPAQSIRPPVRAARSSSSGPRRCGGVNRPGGAGIPALAIDRRHLLAAHHRRRAQHGLHRLEIPVQRHSTPASAVAHLGLGRGSGCAPAAPWPPRSCPACSSRTESPRSPRTPFAARAAALTRASRAAVRRQAPRWSRQSCPAACDAQQHAATIHRAPSSSTTHAPHSPCLAAMLDAEDAVVAQQTQQRLVRRGVKLNGFAVQHKINFHCAYSSIVISPINRRRSRSAPAPFDRVAYPGPRVVQPHRHHILPWRQIIRQRNGMAVHDHAGQPILRRQHIPGGPGHALRLRFDLHITTIIQMNKNNAVTAARRRSLPCQGISSCPALPATAVIQQPDRAIIAKHRHRRDIPRRAGGKFALIGPVIVGHIGICSRIGRSRLQCAPASHCR